MSEKSEEMNAREWLKIESVNELQPKHVGGMGMAMPEIQELKLQEKRPLCQEKHKKLARHEALSANWWKIDRHSGPHGWSHWTNNSL